MTKTTTHATLIARDAMNVRGTCCEVETAYCPARDRYFAARSEDGEMYESAGFGTREAATAQHAEWVARYEAAR